MTFHLCPDVITAAAGWVVLWSVRGREDGLRIRSLRINMKRPVWLRCRKWRSVYVFLRSPYSLGNMKKWNCFLLVTPDIIITGAWSMIYHPSLVSPACVCVSVCVLGGQRLAAWGGWDRLLFEPQVVSITCVPSGCLSVVYQSGEPASSPH